MGTGNFYYNDFLYVVQNEDYEDWKEAYKQACQEEGEEFPEDEDTLISIYGDNQQELIDCCVFDVQNVVLSMAKKDRYSSGYKWGKNDYNAYQFSDRTFGGRIVAEQRYFHNLPDFYVGDECLNSATVTVYYVLRNGYYDGANIDPIICIELDCDDYLVLDSIDELNDVLKNLVRSWVEEELYYLDDEEKDAIWKNWNGFVLPDVEAHTRKLIHDTVSKVPSLTQYSVAWRMRNGETAYRKVEKE